MLNLNAKSGLFRVIKGTFLVKFLGLLFTFSCSVVLARTLGAESYGVYAFFFSLVTILALPTQGGMPTLIMRETAKSKAENNWPKLKGVWFWSGRIILILAISTLLLCYFAFQVFNIAWNDEKYYVFVTGLALALLIALGNCRSAALRGLGLVVQGQVPESLVRPILLLSFVLLCVLCDVEINALYAMSLHLLSALLAFLVGWVMLSRATPVELRSVKTTNYDARRWTYSLLPLSLMAGMQTLSGQLDILILGGLGSASDVGVYKVVVSGSILALFGLQVVNTAISPQIAKLYAQNDSEGLKLLAARGSLISTALTIPVASVLFFWGKEVLSIVFGPEYAIGYWPLMILILGQVINSFFGSCVSVLNMSGHERYTVLGLLASTATNVSLNFLLIPIFGIIGAAWASTVSIIVWNVILWRVAMSKMQIDTTFATLVWSYIRK